MRKIASRVRLEAPAALPVRSRRDGALEVLGKLLEADLTPSLMRTHSWRGLRTSASAEEGEESRRVRDQAWVPEALLEANPDVFASLGRG